MSYFITVALTITSLLLAEGCLMLLRPGEDICTDRALCQTFAPCDLKKCGMEDQPKCSAIQLKSGHNCIKQYRNDCFYQQARCRNQDVSEVPCPANCPAIPADAKKGLVLCSKKE